jgi:hypothetical protein
VLDLIHPSLYCYVDGESVNLSHKSFERNGRMIFKHFVIVISYAFSDPVVPEEPQRAFSWGRREDEQLKVKTRCQWLPAEFYTIRSGSTTSLFAFTSFFSSIVQLFFIFIIFIFIYFILFIIISIISIF